MHIEDKKPCPFCEIVRDDAGKRIILQNNSAFAIRDGYPITPGHTLIIPKRHVQSFFDTTPAEKLDLLELLDISRDAQCTRDARGAGSGVYAASSPGANAVIASKPCAFNIGINDGAAAGQTVPHLHIHLIPRRAGDVKDPRGGVRWVIPGKAKYW